MFDEHYIFILRTYDIQSMQKRQMILTTVVTSYTKAS